MELPKELVNMLEQSADFLDCKDVISDVKECPDKELQKKPLLRVEKDKRKGKTATLITGYEDDCEEVRQLAKCLKQRLAIGGSTRDGEILLQGDVRERVADELQGMGYKIRIIR